MGCNDSGSCGSSGGGDDDEIRRLRGRVDHLARVMCTEFGVSPPQTPAGKMWWERHQAWDRRREAYEASAGVAAKVARLSKSIDIVEENGGDASQLRDQLAALLRNGSSVQGPWPGEEP